MNTTENTYEAGTELAKNDISRFGAVFAMDKLTMFDGEFANGYADAIAGKN